MKPFREAEGYAGDLQAAYDYYRSYSPGVAERFLKAYSRAAKFIAQKPLACRLRRQGWRGS